MWLGQGRTRQKRRPPRGGGAGGKAQGRGQESSKVFPEFRATEEGLEELGTIPQGGQERLSVPLAGGDPERPGWPLPLPLCYACLLSFWRAGS